MAAWRINRAITWCLVVAASIFAIGSAYLTFIATDKRLTADIAASKSSLLSLHNDLYEAATGLVLGTSQDDGRPQHQRLDDHGEKRLGEQDKKEEQEEQDARPAARERASTPLVDTVGYPPGSGTPGMPGSVPSEELQLRLNERLAEQQLDLLDSDASPASEAYRAVQRLSETRRARARRCGGCAVVFPAKQLSGLGYGAEIDAHECVLRFNAGHDGDAARDYGSKQTHKVRRGPRGAHCVSASVVVVYGVILVCLTRTMPTTMPMTMTMLNFFKFPSTGDSRLFSRVFLSSSRRHFVTTRTMPLRMR